MKKKSKFDEEVEALMKEMELEKIDYNNLIGREKEFLGIVKRVMSDAKSRV